MTTVKSREAAWQEANRIFPTDYEKDERASANAGYPIYMSTAEGENSWISDLGCRLELNIMNRKTKGIDTVNIHIEPESEPEITESSVWYSSEIREMCVANNFYNHGNIKEYSDLLEFVERNEPTPINIYKAAKDILDHTSGQEQTVTNIMFMIRNDIVRTFYEIA